MSKIERAFKELQKLRESGSWCCIKLDFDYNYVAEISLTPSAFISKYSSKKEGHKPVIQIRDTEGGLDNLTSLILTAVKKAKEYEKTIKLGS